MSKEMWIPENGLRARFFAAVDEMMGLTNWLAFSGQNPTAYKQTIPISASVTARKSKHDDLASLKLFPRWTMLLAPVVDFDPDEYGDPTQHEPFRNFEVAMDHDLRLATDHIRTFNTALKTPSLVDLPKVSSTCQISLSVIEKNRREKFREARDLIEKAADRAHDEHAAHQFNEPEFRTPDYGRWYDRLATILDDALNPSTYPDLPADRTEWPRALSAEWNEKHAQIKAARGSVTIKVGGTEATAQTSAKQERARRINEEMLRDAKYDMPMHKGLELPIAFSSNRVKRRPTQILGDCRVALEKADFSVVIETDPGVGVRVYCNQHGQLHFFDDRQIEGGDIVILHGEIYGEPPGRDHAEIFLNTIKEKRDTLLEVMGDEYVYQSVFRENYGSYAFCHIRLPDSEEVDVFEATFGSNNREIFGACLTLDEVVEGTGLVGAATALTVYTTSFNAITCFGHDSPDFLVQGDGSFASDQETGDKIKLHSGVELPKTDRFWTMHEEDSFMRLPETTHTIDQEWGCEDPFFLEEHWLKQMEQVQSRLSDIGDLEQSILKANRVQELNRTKDWLGSFTSPYTETLKNFEDVLTGLRAEIEKETKVDFGDLDWEGQRTLDRKALPGRWNWLAYHIVNLEGLVKRRRGLAIETHKSKVIPDNFGSPGASHNQSKRGRVNVDHVAIVKSIDVKDEIFANNFNTPQFRWETRNGNAQLRGADARMYEAYCKIYNERYSEKKPLDPEVKDTRKWRLQGRLHKDGQEIPGLKKAFDGLRNALNRSYPDTRQKK